MKEKVESIKGGKIDFEKELEQQVIDISDLSIKDPPIAKKKYERNVRPKGAIEKVKKQATAWRKRVGIYADQTKAKAQNFVQVVKFVCPQMKIICFLVYCEFLYFISLLIYFSL